MRKPSPAMLVALVSLFVALGGVGIAANGGSLILGQQNSATSQTSLAAPVAGGKTLQLTNNDTTKANSTALGLNVANGHPPFTVSSGGKVANLNADKLDGLDSAAFALRKDAVRMYEPVMNFGTTKTYDVGPYFSLIADCYSSNGTTHLTLHALNNAPGQGFWRAGTVATGYANPGAALGSLTLINSGNDALVTESQNPSPNQYTQIMNNVHGVWTDGTGEAVTAIYTAIAWAHYCDLTGTLIRTT